MFGALIAQMKPGVDKIVDTHRPGRDRHLEGLRELGRDLARVGAGARSRALLCTGNSRTCPRAGRGRPSTKSPTRTVSRPASWRMSKNLNIFQKGHRCAAAPAVHGARRARVRRVPRVGLFRLGVATGLGLRSARCPDGGGSGDARRLLVLRSRRARQEFETTAWPNSYNCSAKPW